MQFAAAGGKIYAAPYERSRARHAAGGEVLLSIAVEVAIAVLAKVPLKVAVAVEVALLKLLQEVALKVRVKVAHSPEQALPQSLQVCIFCVVSR